MDSYSFIGNSRRMIAVATSVWAFVGPLAGCLPRGSDMANRYQRAALPQVLTRVDYAALRSTLLAPRCLNFHEEYETEAGLRRDVIPGNFADSPLYKRMADGTMPPEGPPADSDTLSFVAR